MLSESQVSEILDQGLKARKCSRPLIELPERNTIFPRTTAGCEQFHFEDMGIDSDLIYEREVEFGSKSLHYSYTHCLLVVVYHNEVIDRYTYRGFEGDNITAALNSYLDDYQEVSYL